MILMLAITVPPCRKRRYFVLRKDIRSICYYDNRENLTLLGSIPLDSETKIQHILPKDASKCFE